MTRRFPLYFLFFAVILAASARAGVSQVPPAPAHYLTDQAGVLPPAQRAALDARLENYARATGRQIVVWIGKTTGGVPIDDWAVAAFEKWKIGRKGMDDGVLLVLMIEDRQAKIEVGYGLEGELPDISAWHIIRDEIIPKMKAGDATGAVSGAVGALIQTLGGERHVPGGRSGHRARNQPSLFQTIVFMILGVIFLIFLITHPSMALYLLWAMSSGNRGGGGGGWGGGGGGDGGGGGFSGGGGRSGGGGASGSW